MFNLFSYSFFLAFTFIFFLILFSCSISLGMPYVTNGLIVFDSLSFYLILLVLFLGVYCIFFLSGNLSSSTITYLLYSLFFSCLCFCTNHCILFWCFYELSMLPLLYLIFFDSPYSERFLAGWYFSAYLIITSLPLILILIYLSFINGSFYFSSWYLNHSYFLLVTLSFIFFTKVPLVPFHTWLPIVHAEATSIVSIFLSGYIMKLGLLGVFRCCPFIFSGMFNIYAVVCCFFSVFFILTASLELDGKRWLAFLSLSHIVIPFISLFISNWENINLSFLFCLGHGLSAGLVFSLLWYFYDSSNTRNWLLLKSSLCGRVSVIFVCLSLLSLCSFPPTLQFFCEVMLLSNSVFSSFFIFFWISYLFFSGLIPLIICGHLLIRNECFESVSFSFYNFFFCFFFLGCWCFLGLIIL